MFKITTGYIRFQILRRNCKVTGNIKASPMNFSGMKAIILYEEDFAAWIWVANTTREVLQVVIVNNFSREEAKLC